MTYLQSECAFTHAEEEEDIEEMTRAEEEEDMEEMEGKIQRRSRA
jgi:hypothetical protein